VGKAPDQAAGIQYQISRAYWVLTFSFTVSRLISLGEKIIKTMKMHKRIPAMLISEKRIFLGLLIGVIPVCQQGQIQTQ
jgi:hypothetical protein